MMLLIASLALVFALTVLLLSLVVLRRAMQTAGNLTRKADALMAGLRLANETGLPVHVHFQEFVDLEPGMIFTPLKGQGETPAGEPDERQPEQNQHDAGDAIAARMATGSPGTDDRLHNTGAERVIHPLAESYCHQADAKDHCIFAVDVLEVEGSASDQAQQPDSQEGVIPVPDVEVREGHAAQDTRAAAQQSPTGFSPPPTGCSLPGSSLSCPSGCETTSRVAGQGGGDGVQT